VPTLTWDDVGRRFYERGVDRGVLYLDNADGVAWSGLTSVSMKPVGGKPKGYYIDGVKYLNLALAEEFEGTIEAYTYPDEFAVCDGTARVHSGLFITQQARKSFGFSYRTRVGNDIDPDYAYKIHLVYNALATPSERQYNSIGDNAETMDLSWDISTLPPETTGYRRSAHLVIDTRSANPSAIADVEAVLYGDTEAAARLPTLDELVTIFDAYAVLSVTAVDADTYTIDGPDDAIVSVDADTYTITWPSVNAVDAETYTISSL